MPDWITHVLVAWTLATLLGFKFKEFSQRNAAIVILGALIPDLYKIYLLMPLIGDQILNFVLPVHMPIGSLLIAGIISLFFTEIRKAFFFLILGISTHYILDLLLISSGLELLYPISLFRFQIGIITVYDYHITILSIFMAFIVYIIYKSVNNSEKTSN